MPSTPEEVLGSSLMGMSEKYKLKSFVNFVLNYDATKPDTCGGVDYSRHTMKQVYDKFGLDEGAIDFIGHCLALQTSDDYVMQAAGPCIDKIQLYLNSYARFGKSPFIYPLYGLGTISEGFCRYSAIRGCTYMLNKQVTGF